jgi:hypothetical protein
MNEIELPPELAGDPAAYDGDLEGITSLDEQAAYAGFSPQSAPVELGGPAADDALDDAAYDAFLRRAGGAYGDVEGDDAQLLIDVMILEIEAQLVELRDYQVAIHDGILLAVERVQEIRLGWLEEPTVDVEDFFVEFLLAFLLELPLVGAVLKSTFRFLGDAKKAHQAANIEANIAAISAELKRLKGEAKRATRGGGPDIKVRKQELRQQRRDLRAKRVAPDEVRSFLAELAPEVVPAGLKAGKSARDKGEVSTSAQQPAADAQQPFSVQVIDQAQLVKQRLERYFALVMANARFLQNRARSEQSIMPTAHAMLWEVLSMLHGVRAQHEAQVPVREVKRLMALRTEQLIWAFLVADKYYVPRSIENVVRDTPAILLTGTSLGISSPITGNSIGTSSPIIDDIIANKWFGSPNNLVAYIRNRFYEGQETPVYQIWSELRKLRDDFREQGDLFRVISPGKLKQDDTPQQSVPQPGQEP